MKKDVFQFKNYKTYINARLDEAGARSGLRAKMARQMGVQSSYLSQVLHGNPDLTLEQAFKANMFFEHDSNEAQYFLLLVQKDRAGTMELKNYFQKQISDLLQERDKIKSRLNQTTVLNEEIQSRYYSSWDYIGVHMALSVPELRTPKNISQSLNVPLERVEKILQFLVENGLAQLNGREYFVGSTHLHLGSDSAFIHQHHANWRLESMRRLANLNQGGQLNYSAVFSISKNDYLRLRENLMRVIQENLAVVKPSEDEMIVCQIIDLIPLS